MRILAFSDLHCDSESARKIVLESESANVVVGAGDFGIRGERTVELLDILKEISIPLLLVPGNHDRRAELASYCDSQDNMYFLDGSFLEILGITFFGLGGEIPSRSDFEWNETLDEHTAAQLLLDAPTHDVLITHTPPYGYCDLQKNGDHEGSESIADSIRRSSPSLCLCGHIHHSWGSVEQLRKTKVHNVGPEPCLHIVTN